MVSPDFVQCENCIAIDFSVSFLRTRKRKPGFHSWWYNVQAK